MGTSGARKRKDRRSQPLKKATAGKSPANAAFFISPPLIAIAMVGNVQGYDKSRDETAFPKIGPMWYDRGKRGRG